jgi:hypothetical protein
VGFLFFKNIRVLKNISVRASETGIPKALRQALHFLATDAQINYLTATLQDQLDQANPSSTAQGLSPELPWDLDAESDAVIDIDWTEGVEEFKELSSDDIFTLLGFSDKTIPFFNRLQDPYGLHDPWTNEGKEWFDDARNGDPLALRWHQQVGDAKMLMNAFAGKPILQMDGVGQGKTIQSTSLVASLAYYRGYYATHGSFPGVFGESVSVCFSASWES